MIVERIEKELKKVATKERAQVCTSFFKTGKGEYGEGDIFLGVTVPDTRNIVKTFLHEIEVRDAVVLLKSQYHEERLAGCIAMVELFKKSGKDKNENKQKEIYTAYIQNTDRINNWDLVDVSCKDIVGVYVLEKDRKILYKLAKSKSLWERRIAIVSTWTFIRKGEYKDIFALCEIVMNDKEDLMHKACGWMLREVGRCCGVETLDIFLEKYKSDMPRTMLRYATERHHPVDRARLLAGI